MGKFLKKKAEAARLMATADELLNCKDQDRVLAEAECCTGVGDEGNGEEGQGSKRSRP